tara:strand:+ start:214 stop:1140 length:927 start_codon:yes stop_codon:yes gene_type:complete
MIEEQNEDIQVQLDDLEESSETIEIPNEEQEASPDSGGEDELDKYTRGVSKRINKLNERIRMAEERASNAEGKYYSLQGEYNNVKSRANVLDKSYTDEYESRVKSQRQQAEDLYKKARETNDPDLELKSVELLNKVSLEEERVRLAKMQQQQQEDYNSQAVQQNVQKPREQVYDKPKPDSKAVDWAEKNTWFQKDRVKTYTAMGIHEDLQSEGFDGSSDEYYEELDNRLNKVLNITTETTDKKGANSSVQRVASASTGSRQQAQGKRNGVTISPNHVSVRSNLKPYGMSEKEWLKRIGKEIVKLEGAK